MRLRIVLTGTAVVIGIKAVRIAIGMVPLEEALRRCLGGEISAISIAEGSGRLGCHSEGHGGDDENGNDETETANR